MTAARGADPVRSAVRAWLLRHLAPDDPVVVTCSGGADSLALAIATIDCSGSRPVFVATVDHGLQPGSAARAAATADILRGIGYPDPAILTATVEGPGGMEAAARRARYRVLAEYALTVVPGRSYAVLLAHTADDQAETVLLGLGRGSGPRSIAGMRAWREPWGRPLLGVERADTEQVCRLAGLSPWQDPHNDDPSFTRVRVRHEVLPLLNDVLGGGVRDALTRTATLMMQDLDALDALASQLAGQVTGEDGGLDIPGLARSPGAIVGRVLRAWAMAGGAGPLTFDQLGRMTRQVVNRNGPSQVRLPGGWDVVRIDDVLRLIPLRPTSNSSGTG